MIALAAAAWATDPVAEALATELDRAVDALSLPAAPPPYFVWGWAFDGWTVATSASLGAVDDRAVVRPDRDFQVLVRVGDAALDQTNFDSWKGTGGGGALVLGSDVVALRHDVWLKVDSEYKGAVETLAAKIAARERRAEPVEIPSFVPGAAVVAEDPTPVGDVDAPALEALVREVSAVFRDHTALEWSEVSASARGGRRTVVDTGGTRVQAPSELAWVRIAARVRAGDGSTLVDAATHVARRAGELPDTAALVADARALAARLEEWRDRPAETEEYVGPVLFEGDAAVDLFRWLLLPELSGTPGEEKAPRGSRIAVWDDTEAAGPARLKRRVLPTGWEVVDDPLADPADPASVRWDLEGVAAERVLLVQDGIVRGHLMSRTPSASLQGSNGHGLELRRGLVVAGPAVARVTPDRRSTAAKLHRAALALADDYDLDHYLVVRRIRPPGLDRESGGPWITGRQWLGFDDDAELPPPVELVRVFPDGREEVVRGLEIAGLDPRTLASIAAAGATHTSTFRSGNRAVTLSAPDVLLPEVELAPSTAPSEKPPLVPSPLAAP